MMASERNLQYDPERPHSLVIPYGLDYQQATILPSNAEYPFLRLNIEGREVRTNLVGTYNADNVMAAICVGRQFGISLEEAADAIEAYCPSNNRSQMVRKENNTLIIDAYNANPSSMESALNNFADIQAERKVVMLGDMLELGADSIQEHVNVMRKVLAMNLDQIYLVGAEFASALAQVNENIEKVQHFMSSDKLAERLVENKVEDSVVLIKGSRGTRMEKVVEKL
jgi:UDP-N-acetylmuramoyl-tripeptide--D-alanyl-D-alanine ligase